MNVISHSTEQKEAVWCYLVNDQLWKMEYSVDLQKVQVREYRVGEVIFFSSAWKSCKLRFFSFFREQNDFESNEGIKYLKTVGKTYL